MDCQYCGATIDDDAELCPECGQAVAEEEKSCRRCGANKLKEPRSVTSGVGLILLFVGLVFAVGPIINGGDLELVSRIPVVGIGVLIFLAGLRFKNTEYECEACGKKWTE